MAQKAEEGDAKQKGKSGGSAFGLLLLAMGCLVSAGATVYVLTPASVDQATICGNGHESVAPAAPLVSSEKTYVELQEVLITIGSAPATRYLRIRISIVTGKDGANTVKKAEPVLIDAFVNYLRSVELTDFEDPGFYTHMREQLARRAELVLGGGTSHGVLITEFLLR